MDGIHDLGGLEGFGPVSRTRDEAVFHAEWERRVFALVSAVPFAVPFGDDQLRPAIERLPPAHYLSMPYYARWLEALIDLLQERGALTVTDLQSGSRSPPLAGVTALPASQVTAAIVAGASQRKPATSAVPRRFAVGDPVRTRRHMAARHTRLPRYARDRVGTVEALHGAFLLADRHAEGVAQPETLYTVVFDAGDLWGEARAGDRVSLDLWDSYLESAR